MHKATQSAFVLISLSNACSFSEPPTPPKRLEALCLPIKLSVSRYQGPQKTRTNSAPAAHGPKKRCTIIPVPACLSSFPPFLLFEPDFQFPRFQTPPASHLLAHSIKRRSPVRATGPTLRPIPATWMHHPLFDAPPMLRCTIHASKHHPCLTRASSSSARSTWPSWPPPASPPAPAPEGKPAPPRPWADSARRQCRRSARIP